MSTEEIDVLKLFREAAFEVSGRKLEGLTLNTAFSELALDSVIVLEVVSHVEQTLSIRIEDEDLNKLQTMADLKALIQKARKAA
jgi:acyl carrier protein